MVHILSHALGVLALAALFVVTGRLCQQCIPPLRSWRFDVILVRLTLGSLAWAVLMFALAPGQWL